MSSLEVVHVAQPTDAGVARCVADYVTDQVRRGWSVSVVSPDTRDLARWSRAAGARHVPWSATRSPGGRTFSEAKDLHRKVRDLAPQIVHLHSSKAGLAGRLALRGRRPTIYQPHAWSFEAVEGSLRRAAIAWERWSARWADRIVCVSEDERKSGLALGIRGRFEVIPNGVALDPTIPSDAERLAARQRLGLPRDPTIVLCVGRLARQKGQTTLLDAWRGLARSDALLVLIGDGPDEARLRAQASEAVVFAGRSPDVAGWYEAADLLVVPSRWEAGMSLVTMEGMARGLPVVATAVAGMVEGLRGAGEVVPIDDVVALRQAIAIRLDDPELRRTEGRAARAAVERNHDLRITTTRVAELYESLMA